MSESSAAKPSKEDLASQITSTGLESVSDTPDAHTEQEAEVSQRTDLERKTAELESYKQDTQERKKYAGRIFALICAWLVGVYLAIFLQGMGQFTKFSLSEPVLLAVIGSTTVNVLGIFYIVANYLFPKSPGNGA